MSHSGPPIWQVLQSKGYSRREFLRFCSFAAGDPLGDLAVELSTEVETIVPELAQAILAEAGSREHLFAFACQPAEDSLTVE